MTITKWAKLLFHRTRFLMYWNTLIFYSVLKELLTILVSGGVIKTNGRSFEKLILFEHSQKLVFWEKLKTKKIFTAYHVTHPCHKIVKTSKVCHFVKVDEDSYKLNYCVYLELGVNPCTLRVPTSPLGLRHPFSFPDWTAASLPYPSILSIQILLYCILYSI